MVLEADFRFSGITLQYHNEILTFVSACRGSIAQRLEQGTHNPLVPGSNPGGPMASGKMKITMKGWAKVDPWNQGWSRVVDKEFWI